MKFLIGVCGIGRGHCVRQYELARELLMRGHQVQILTFSDGLLFFENTQLEADAVYVPYITYNSGQPDIVDIVRRNAASFFPGTKINVRVVRRLRDEDFIPDVCISDYEPVTARIAYHFHRPLVSIDQQSKFLYMSGEPINGFSCAEEKKRLSLFLPRCDWKFIFSFYKLPNTELPEHAELIYPIIRQEIKLAKAQNQRKNVVIVYFSQYIDIPISQTSEEIIRLFNRFPDYDFLFFSSELYRSGLRQQGNVAVLENGGERFSAELAVAAAVISTAGHTLIAESVYCEVPVFVIPLPTYDQNYCGKFVLDNQIGYSANGICEENLRSFLENLDIYRENMKSCGLLVPPADTLGYLVQRLEAYGE